MSSNEHTIIVGGGIVGVSTAYYLAKRGHRVTLVDRGCFDTCCSTGNAGIIALGHPPMPRPGLIGETLRMLFNPLNPLYVPPRFDVDLMRWLWDFRKACSPKHFDRSMRILTEIGFLAGEAFDELIDEENLDCEYHRTGWLDIFSTPKRFEQGRAEADLIRSYGYDVHVVSGEELRRRDPAFRESVIGAAHYSDSRFANPGRLLRELADRSSTYGATLRTNAEVKSITISDGRFESVVLDTGEELTGSEVVLAGGAWTTELAKSIGVDVPMQPGKGYHMNVILPTGAPRVTTTCVLAETFIAVTPISADNAEENAEQCLRLAGTVEFSGMNHTLVQKRLDMLRIGAERYLQRIEDCRPHSTWCGLRPCTADGLPVIGWAPTDSGVESVFIATGHAMMGFALGPITGKLVTECILDGEASMDISPFSPSRHVRNQTVATAR